MYRRTSIKEVLALDAHLKQKFPLTTFLIVDFTEPWILQFQKNSDLELDAMLSGLSLFFLLSQNSVIKAGYLSRRVWWVWRQLLHLIIFFSDLRVTTSILLLNNLSQTEHIQ